jgi:hypothetical protein
VALRHIYKGEKEMTTTNISQVQNCSELESNLSSLADEISKQVEEESALKRAKMDEEMQGIQDDMPDTDGVDAIVKLDVDITWDDTEILIPWVEFEVDWKEIKMDLPQVKMSNKEFIFHTPSVRMVNKKIGQYPEFTCSGLNCKVKWTDIITKVPETFMEEQRIVMGVPEFWVDTTSISIPELKIDFSQKRIVMGLPQFTVKEIEVEAREARDKANTLADKYKLEFNQLAESSQSFAKARVSSKVHELFECHQGNLNIQKEMTVKSIEAQVQATQVQFEIAKSKGIPEAISKIETAITKLNTQKEQIVAQFQEMIDNLMDKEKQAIKEMTDGSGN